MGHVEASVSLSHAHPFPTCIHRHPGRQKEPTGRTCLDSLVRVLLQLLQAPLELLTQLLQLPAVAARCLLQRHLQRQQLPLPLPQQLILRLLLSCQLPPLLLGLAQLLWFGGGGGVSPMSSESREGPKAATGQHAVAMSLQALCAWSSQHWPGLKGSLWGGEKSLELVSACPSHPSSRQHLLEGFEFASAHGVAPSLISLQPHG